MLEIFRQVTEPSSKPTLPPTAPMDWDGAPNTSGLSNLPFLKIGPRLLCGAKVLPSPLDQSFISVTSTSVLRLLAVLGEIQVEYLEEETGQGVPSWPPR